MIDDKTLFTIKFTIISSLILIFTILNILMIKFHIEFFIKGNNNFQNVYTLIKYSILDLHKSQIFYS